MRVTGPLIKIVRELLRHHAAGEEVYGLTLIRDTKLKSGTVYPLLDRLVVGGLAEARFETDEEKDRGRPRRRYYRLTGNGAAQSVAWLQEYDIAPPGGLQWATP